MLPMESHLTAVVVYVHCKAGHGRSAAVVLAWLLYKEPLADPQDLNEKLCSLRDVRKSLWKQPNINIYLEWLKEGGMTDSESDEDDYRHRTSSKKSTKKDLSGGEEDSVIFGKVFSDEDESSWTDESDFDFSDGAGSSDFEDERGYDIWRR